MIFTILILASALPPIACSQKLLQMEVAFKDWTSSSRTVSATHEQHRYFKVTKDGRTVFMTLRAALSRPEGFTFAEPCTLDAKPAAVYYQVIVKP